MEFVKIVGCMRPCVPKGHIINNDNYQYIINMYYICIYIYIPILYILFTHATKKTNNKNNNHHYHHHLGQISNFLPSMTSWGISFRSGSFNISGGPCSSLSARTARLVALVSEILTVFGYFGPYIFIDIHTYMHAYIHTYMHT